MPYLRNRKLEESHINAHDYRIFERIMEERHNPRVLNDVLIRAEINGLSADTIRRFIDPNYGY